MSHRVRLYLGIVFGFIFILAIIIFIWGNTWRMFLANRYYSKADYERAQERYENLLVDLPNSPYILHNLGLSFFKNERNEKAITNLREAVGKLEGSALAKSRKSKLKNIFCYNMGNTLYNSAEKSQDEQGQANYQEAFLSFKQAIEADPKDLNAKYNYELTLLRLKQPPPNKPPEQQQDETQNIMNMNDAEFFVPPNREEEPVDKDW